jgi:hypothetical protein
VASPAVGQGNPFNEDLTDESVSVPCQDLLISQFRIFRERRLRTLNGGHMCETRSLDRSPLFERTRASERKPGVLIYFLLSILRAVATRPG